MFGISKEIEEIVIELCEALIEQVDSFSDVVSNALDTMENQNELIALQKEYYEEQLLSIRNKKPAKKSTPQRS